MANGNPRAIVKIELHWSEHKLSKIELNEV